MGKRGRPPVLDEMKQREILALLSVGCSHREAARYVGCARATIMNTAGRDPKFAGRLRQAAYAAEVGYLQNIQKAARKEQYWRAAAWALERTMPEKYARRGPDVITVEQMSQILNQFAEILIAEVPVDFYRKNIVKRLDVLRRSLGGAPGHRAVVEEAGDEAREEEPAHDPAIDSPASPAGLK